MCVRNPECRNYSVFGPMTCASVDVATPKTFIMICFTLKWAHYLSKGRYAALKKTRNE